MHTFSRCASLKNIEIPNTIKTIGSHAFYRCYELKNIIVPDSVKAIEKGAFEECRNLESIKLPDTLESLGESIFADCKKLVSVNIPSKINSLSKRIFHNCKKLPAINIPENIKTIGDSAFFGCTFKEFTIPDSVTEIGGYIFSDCTNLEKITLSKNLTTIPEYAFDSCFSLEELSVNGKNSKFIDIPENIKKVQNSAFNMCESIKKVVFPKNLDNLGEYAFKNCNSLKEIKLPENLEYIKDYTFNNCLFLENLILPETLTYIGDNAFENCQNLKSINIPKTVTEIGKNAFSKCIELKEISLPDNIEEIKDHCFDTCLSLEKVKLPANLKKFGEYTFSKTALSSIEIPEGVKDGGNYTFFDCSYLKDIKLPSTLENINKGMMQGCVELKEINIPKSVKSIGNYAFSNCYSLEKIDLHTGLKTISYGAFYKCPSLNDINIPETVESVKTNAFDSCPSLTEIYFPESVKELGYSRNDFNFFEKCESGFKLSSNQTQKSIPTNTLKIDLPLLSRHYDKREMFFKEQKNPNICNFYNIYLTKQPETRIQEFLYNHNFTFFKQLPIPNVPEKQFEMYNMLYNLGAVSTPIQVNGKNVDYAQKVVGLILEKIRKKEITLPELRDSFIYMNTDGFKPEFTDFFLNAFDELLNEDGLSKGFMSRCYNEFEDVQRTNTSNRGSQRQLKPTISKFLYYFMDNKFAGVNESNKHIADALSPYFHDQKTFDLALQIEQERIRNNTPDHILNEPLTDTPFEKIDEMVEAISQTRIDTIENLLQMSFNQFSYEWLAKNDPQNLILGKLCSCCAHIEGGGYGIMHASIVDPYVQNLVIKNNNGRIVAKSTLYINPIEKFGVFNNVEVSDELSVNDKKEIYKKFIAGAKAFAEAYNKKHPERPLKQINVGMNLNDLTAELHRHNKESKTLFKALDYSKYGRENQMYSGDSDLEQFIVWTNEDSQNINKENEMN